MTQTNHQPTSPQSEVAHLALRRLLRVDPAAGSLRHQVPAWIISVFLHAAMLTLFLIIGLRTRPVEAAKETIVIQTHVEEETREPNLQNEDEGLDPSRMLNYNLERIENVSVPGKDDLAAPVGIQGGEVAAPPMNIPPPPGFGGGQGGASDLLKPGTASPVGLPGGHGGPFVPGGFAGRSGATRVKMALEGGGNTASEAAVARGLTWIARHQAPDGRWGLDDFNQAANCRCGGLGLRNDIAGTAFGLLPLLGAGEHHRNPRARYGKNCERGLKFLISKQQANGDFTGGMYAHCLATIAMCEAYAMTGDPLLKQPAQKALNYIRAAQHEAGGWRYEPKQAGDTSVVGWAVMALKSGQMGGLEADDPREPTFARSMKFLDSVMTSDGSGYGYTRPGDAPTTTAIGLLCRQYLGWGPRNANLLAGIRTLKKHPPDSLNSLYYYYYATQVLHHLGGEDWKAWNEKMRDLLVQRQDKGEKNPHAAGSWDPRGDAYAAPGGRLMVTSLSLCTLEVYYRHLPLYRRDSAGGKD